MVKRPKFDKYSDTAARYAFLLQYFKGARQITPLETITACRDPKDDQFLELAVAGKADMIISRDNDLLELHPFRGIQIMDAEAFLAQMNAT